ncbi:MAG: YdiU family protein [Clostridia bacterium]|nr:YdiU family protein [Clostridia bacterium]
MTINLQHDYTRLPDSFYQKVKPTPVKSPKILLLNELLLSKLNFSKKDFDADKLSGNTLFANSEPIAQAYAGHQYGHFTMLGDGRAILLGEILVENELIDVQLKGSGPTQYSRSGDGRATLRSMVREYIMSEAMEGLKIPTTRSLGVVLTGEKVYREVPHQGAVLTRLSKGHIRVGTFQFASAHGHETLIALADYVIERMSLNWNLDENKYVNFFEKVIASQSELIAKWQSIGFIHGVMNTDNMSVFSETIDYGPCAFMDQYHSKTVFSSIDHYGRYAYDQQPAIAKWNLARLGECLLPLFSEDENEALLIANDSLSKFDSWYKRNWLDHFSKKIGLKNHTPEDEPLIHSLLSHLESYQYDFTNTFVQLSAMTFAPKEKPLLEWQSQWIERLTLQGPLEEAQEIMQAVNPQIIPRNHVMEHILDTVEKHDLSRLEEWLEALRHPYQKPKKSLFTTPPESNEVVYKTYCGT